VTLVKDEGDLVIKGEALIVLSENGQALTVRAPTSGKILSVNRSLRDDGSLRHEDLFGSGWTYIILPSRPEELRSLMIGSESKSWMDAELNRLQQWFMDSMASGTRASMWNGDARAPGMLPQTGPDARRQFEQQFFQAQ
jgi:hypothetical protein